MRIFIITVFLLSNIQIIQAQEQEEQVPANSPVDTRVGQPQKLYGKIKDITSDKGLEAASIQLFQKDSISENKLVAGMLSRPNGDFIFENIKFSGTYKLLISAIGYKEYETTLNFNELQLPADLGNIVLEPDTKQLQSVVITSTKPALQLGIDRKIFNVEKSLTAAGGTAVDVMRLIPSVKVDIEGNVELRNSAPQIYIDGRPTILTLDQIPADNIERVELITNPSAKFEASSSGGIINIVLKKNKRFGLNGKLSVTWGTPEVLGSNFDFNIRQGKINFFASAGFNNSGGIGKSETERQNKSAGVITNYFNQNSRNERDRKFKYVRFGADYFIDNRNSITLSHNIVNGRFSNNEVQNQEYLTGAKMLEYYGLRQSDGSFGFDRSRTQFNYKHNFPEQGKELTADITYNKGGRSENSAIVNSWFNPDDTEYKPANNVENDGSSSEDQYTFQVDFVNPLSDSSKFETGLRSFINEYGSYYNAYSVNNNINTKLPLSNNYRYNQMINALYVTYSAEKEKFSYQLGFRAEYSKFTGTLVDSSYKFGYEYPNKVSKLWDAIFPSVFLTRKINDDEEVQINFSRRIRRPNFWQLNPFIEINDPVNLEQGNPELKPEFINSFELNYNKNFGSNNFLGALYFRNNPDDITQYSDTITDAQYQLLSDAAIDPNAILNTYINAGVTNRYGAEVTLQYKIGESFDFTPSFNLQYRTVKARVKDIDLSNKGFNWEAKLTSNYKIKTEKNSFFNNFMFQLQGEYESPRVIPQGRRLPEYKVDFGLRKDFLKKEKATFTFSVDDVFNTRRNGTIYDTENFYQNSYGRWRVRSFRITLSYRFGDPNFSLLKTGQRNGNGGGGTDD